MAVPHSSRGAPGKRGRERGVESSRRRPVPPEGLGPLPHWTGARVVRLAISSLWRAPGG